VLLRRSCLVALGFVLPALHSRRLTQRWAPSLCPWWVASCCPTSSSGCVRESGPLAPRSLTRSQFDGLAAPPPQKVARPRAATQKPSFEEPPSQSSE